MYWSPALPVCLEHRSRVSSAGFILWEFHFLSRWTKPSITLVPEILVPFFCWFWLFPDFSSSKNRSRLGGTTRIRGSMSKQKLILSYLWKKSTARNWANEKASVVFHVWDEEGQNLLHIIIWNKNALDVDFVVKIQTRLCSRDKLFTKLFGRLIVNAKLYMTVWRQLMFKWGKF